MGIMVNDKICGEQFLGLRMHLMMVNNGEELDNHGS